MGEAAVSELLKTATKKLSDELLPLLGSVTAGIENKKLEVEQFQQSAKSIVSQFKDGQQDTVDKIMSNWTATSDKIKNESKKLEEILPAADKETLKKNFETFSSKAIEKVQTTVGSLQKDAMNAAKNAVAEKAFDQIKKIIP